MAKILVVSSSGTDQDEICRHLPGHQILYAKDYGQAERLLRETGSVDLLVVERSLQVSCAHLWWMIQNEEAHFGTRAFLMIDADEEEPDDFDCIRRPFDGEYLKRIVELQPALQKEKLQWRKQLHEQVTLFRRLADQVPIGIVISLHPEGVDTDYDEYITQHGSYYVNATSEKMLGRNKRELLKSGWKAITHPDDLEKNMALYRDFSAGRIESFEMEKRFIKPDGSIVWVLMAVNRLYNIPGKVPLNHIALLRDITESNQMTERLVESERSKAFLLANLQGMVYRCDIDAEWTMQFVSSDCEALTGYKPIDLIGNRVTSYNDLIAPAYRASINRLTREILKNRRPFRAEYELRTINGESKWVLEFGQGIYNEHGEAVAMEGIIFDITDRKKMENRLVYLSEHNKLTGLYNEDYLRTFLSQRALEKPDSKKSLIMVDLSLVLVRMANYGFHHIQSLILSAARTLEKLCNENCSLFHTHDIHFVLYLEGVESKTRLYAFAESVAAALEKQSVSERITFGIGILEVWENEPNPDIDMILRKLLIATERSKNTTYQDFGITFYNRNLEAAITRENEVHDALSSALAGSEGSRVKALFQPIIDVQSGMVTGFEALARLQSDTLGMVSPLEFIPLAEKNRLIIALDEQMLEKSCKFLKKLDEKGHHRLSVAVNVSALHLLHPDFIPRVTDTISRLQVNAERIDIEITESVFASDYDACNRIISRLQQLGMKVSIDDFGAGYSSLARQKSLRVDCLKIDKFFIDQLLSTEPDKRLTGDIISMAHKLGYNVVAEGVEYESQLEYLKENKCDRFQGFLIAKPLDEADALEFIEKNGKKHSV